MRYAAESIGYSFNAYEMFKQPFHMTYWVVDSTGAEAAHLFEGHVPATGFAKWAQYHPAKKQSFFGMVVFFALCLEFPLLPLVAKCQKNAKRRRLSYIFQQPLLVFP